MTKTSAGPQRIFVGDVQGCADELEELLVQLGYRATFSGSKPNRSVAVEAPPGRRALFVGDLVPESFEITPGGWRARYEDAEPETWAELAFERGERPLLR